MQPDWVGPDGLLGRFIREESTKTLRAYADQPNLVTEHVNTEDALARGGYADRQLLELIQNSTDALADTGGGRIRVKLTKSHLYCADNGLPIDEDGVRALMFSRISPKRGTNQIGRYGLMLGVRQLGAEAGRRVICELAVDTDADALAVHVRNHRTRRLSTESVTSLVDYRTRGTGSEAEFVYPPTLVADRLAAGSDGVDLVVAGPPCQGHSNLNNHSRRNDRRNLLYLTVPAFAVACGAKAVVIENVTSVVHDKTDVVHTTRRLLESCGYAVTQGILAADAMGWPQTRKRHFLVARRIVDSDAEPPVPIGDVQAGLKDSPPRSVLWAIGSGQTMSHDRRLHTASDLAALNRDRIQWLFDNDEHDLALAERPDCHQNGTSYGAVYGRMYADRPAPTITTGYMTPGRGRFVHPTEPRTLTPAEAARLQGFPDDYLFNPDPDQPASRSQLAKWIGDAVATPLGYAAAFCALAPDIAASTI